MPITLPSVQSPRKHADPPYLSTQAVHELGMRSVHVHHPGWHTAHELLLHVQLPQDVVGLHGCQVHNPLVRGQLVQCEDRRWHLVLMRVGAHAHPLHLCTIKQAEEGAWL